jgi:phenylpropionate dioxygenase-like ring-hydroxylating dioxygenase large terminal subunit
MNAIEPLSTFKTDGSRDGLPPWTYFNAELLELEKSELFRKTWQCAGHVSDIPEPGDYLAFDIVGERALIVRGKDRKVRAFHNVCRHRGSRVVADDQGRCKSALVCPFHGWSYNLDGTLRAVPQAKSFPALDAKEHGLQPVEFEIWHGFMFVRFVPGSQPSVAELMTRYDEAVRPYRLEEVKPYSGFKSESMNVNWKAVRDVDNEGYHVPIAHPALQDLYGGNYNDSPSSILTEGTFNQGVNRYWSVRHYKKILPHIEHLPEKRQKQWNYTGLFPNLVFMLYPDLVGFYQEFPIAVDKTIQRIAYYARPDSRREARLSRYLAHRIDKITTKEDAQLIAWSWESMQSSGFRGMILGDNENGVRSYHNVLRKQLPVTQLKEAPSTGSLAVVNKSMSAEQFDRLSA